MLNTLGIVKFVRERRQVDSKIGRKLGGKSLLEWAVRRVTDCQRLDGVVRRAGDRGRSSLCGSSCRPTFPSLLRPATIRWLASPPRSMRSRPLRDPGLRRPSVRRSGVDRPPGDHGRRTSHLRLHQLLSGRRTSRDLDAGRAAGRMVFRRLAPTMPINRPSGPRTASMSLDICTPIPSCSMCG